MKGTLTSIALLSFLSAFSQTKNDSLTFRNIADVTMDSGKAYSNLYELTKTIGHRLSGSTAYEKATDWAAQKLKEAGADKVWKQEVKVPVWTRGKESLQIQGKDGQWRSVKMLSLGNSEGTKGNDLTGEIIVVKSIDEFEKMPDSKIKDKIILFNYPFPQNYIYTMEGYREASPYRRNTATLVAKKGGKAVLVRSLSTAFDDVPHTGGMRYEDGVKKIPAITVGPKTADELESLAQQQKITAKINSHCGMNGEKLTYNVIGEISGKKDNKVIVAGGHLDSWDVGEGAHDDGAGIVQAIEIINIFKKLNIQNNHTIRVVCFANEENGTRGGDAYADSIKVKNENHLFAIESDSGGYAPRGISLEMDESKRKQIQSWQSLFLPYGVYDFSLTHSGSDIEPMKMQNVPLSGLIPDSQRYFDLHHSESDTFEKVNRRELLLGAVTMAQIVYLIDKNW